ncbi:MAG TPA: prephenate dehydratase domain-containing protein [Gemmatimonadaceae bacterium]|nr:prephenate dehydratase domain-containing protein [Gemmatimonadaceae bacterium]
MSEAVRKHARLRVAFQGELGSFSDEAIQQLWGGDVERVPYRDFADVTASVASGIADIGVLPIENTIVGSIAGTHDAISAMPGLFAVAETVVAVHHCLLATPGTDFGQLTTVLSHPVALAQCGRFFAEYPQLEVHAVYDTAGAAMDVSRVADPTMAAVASVRAAQHYGLQVLRADIEDRNDNQTRFLAIARAAEPLPAGTPARTMVIIKTADTPGSLLHALTPLSRHGVNIRRLEPRPTGEPWSYRFFMEFDHQVGDTAAEAVVRDIAASAAETRLLGTYPRWGTTGGGN